MALLTKEATSVRRVLEPLFHSFDTENYWASEKGLACSVLMHLQCLLEESGESWVPCSSSSAEINFCDLFSHVALSIFPEYKF